MRVSAPSSCSGVVFVRCLVAIGRTRARSTPETAMNATSCSAVAPPRRATAIRVAGLPGTDEAVPLGWALTALRGLGERRFRLVLPVPGDVRGLPRVTGLAPLALESGQAAIGEQLALVPETLGPEVVQWTVFPLAGAPPGAPPPGGNLRAGSGAPDPAVGGTARAPARPHAAPRDPQGAA